jgi:hypothetical protein
MWCETNLLRWYVEIRRHPWAELAASACGLLLGVITEGAHKLDLHQGSVLSRISPVITINYPIFNALLGAALFTGLFCTVRVPRHRGQVFIIFFFFGILIERFLSAFISALVRIIA